MITPSDPPPQILLVLLSVAETHPNMYPSWCNWQLSAYEYIALKCIICLQLMGIDSGSNCLSMELRPYKIRMWFLPIKMSFWVWGVVVPPLTLLLYCKISPPPLFRCQKDATTPFLTKKNYQKKILR